MSRLRRLAVSCLTLVALMGPFGLTAAVVGASSAAATTSLPTGPGTVRISSSSLPLSGVNIVRQTDQLVAYTRVGTQVSSPANQWGIEVAVYKGSITAISDRQVTGAPGMVIPIGGYVVSGHRAARTWLSNRAKVGRRVDLLMANPTPSTSTFTPGALPAKIVGNYWTNWKSPRLTAGDPRVNVFFLAFALSAQSGTGLIGFTPDDGGGVTKDQMIADISSVQARGARVILSIGGANDGGITMTDTTQVAQMVGSINTICDTYHCDGIDWDLEHGGTGTNLTSLVSASAQLKAARGAGFVISASVQPNLSLYEQFALSTGSATANGKTYSGPVCDLYGPQFYDYEATPDVRKADIVANARKMVSLGLPAQKYLIGATYAGSPLGAAGEMPPSDYLSAYTTLRDGGVGVRGGYVWEMTIEAQNSYVFAETFGPALGV